MAVRPGNISSFGTMPNGDEAFQIDIVAGALSASVITFGAAVQALRLAGFENSLVLGLNTLEHYIDHSPHFGAIAGRVANRLAFGRFELDGQHYQVDRNVDGVHSLHGGSAGFGVRNWQIEDCGADFVTLKLISLDGDMGFPGEFIARCRYSITGERGLRVELSAETNAPTLCNLAHHSYFNLEGEGDCLSHLLMIDAGKITNINANLVPDGTLLEVAGTSLDFRDLRQISDGEPDGSMRFDHNYCLSDKPTSLRQVAKVQAPASGISMQVLTTEPGLQFYDGAKIAVPVEGLDGRCYSANAGLCLEAQHWPDAPNHPQFPSVELRPGETYRQVTEFRFER